ncbi:CPBP family intramembrane metalloprotease [Paenibacillus pinisoli]|uniref:CPBP family intramembrane metalloprotease n=1 Tax=Paenibacillus pinisoli TaxID=1276110 RepID=A0A3A6Q5R9_9BACL|nr:type II CAAX endopeptidase family protein [Paenibacillus pinisoli]RJX41194.1 CPBP family intramembrane metalloprotease [Paenibacillus pinisoli]
MKNPWVIMLSRVVVVVGLYFAWFLTVNKLFFDYIYPLDPWFERNTVSIIILNDIVGFPLMLLAWRFLFKENLFKAAKFRVMDRKSVGLALWIGLGAGLFTVAFSQLPAIASENFKFRELFDYLNRAEWYVFLTFLILGNIYKETLFRGVLMNEFRRVFPVWLAIAIQGVLYGALFFFGDIPLSLYGFLGAVIFALLYVWFKSIWAPIAAQIACQGSQYLLWHYGPESDNVAVLSAAMAIAGVMVASGLFFAVRHRGQVAASVPDEAVTTV